MASANKARAPSGDSGQRGLIVAEAAEALVGAPFRLFGRDRDTGLDCVGLVSHALQASGATTAFPVGYSLRMRNVDAFIACAGVYGLVRLDGTNIGADGARRLPGDVLMFAIGQCQFHFAIVDSAGGLVHAHAGLRRVVRSTAPDTWTPAGHWRLASDF